MKNKVKNVLLGLLVLFMTVSCAIGTHFMSTDKLEGEWTVVFAEDYHGFTDKPITIKFDLKEKHLSGRAICNGYGAGFSVDKEGNLKIGNLMSTRVACQGLTLESDFLKTLQTVTFVGVKSNKRAYLFAKKGDKEPLLVLKR